MCYVPPGAAKTQIEGPLSQAARSVPRSAQITRMSPSKKARTEPAPFSGMHILSCDQFDEAMLRTLFETASAMKAMVAAKAKSDLLQGKILANVFFEPSTRTMCSFDAAMKRLGGDVISISESTSSAKKGETIEDTIRCLQCYCDVLVMRHPTKGTAAKAAAAASKPVINAGDGVGEHPTQALLDLFTVIAAHDRVNQEIDLRSLTLALVGDLKHGRTVHSLARLVTKLSRPPSLTMVAPSSLTMPASICDELAHAGLTVNTEPELKRALPSADVLYVTRVQRERFGSEAEYHAVAGTYVIDSAAMVAAKSDMIIMHPLPRVDEIAPEVDSDPRAKYFEQMENGMYVRMALLALVLGADLTHL